MNRDFLKITAVYTLGVIFMFYLIWLLLDLALPEADITLVRALQAAFNIELPENILEENKNLKVAAVVLIVSVLSIGLIIINTFFGAIVTERLIHPRVRLITSSRGVLSHKWNAERPYILVRMSNFYKCDLADVRISAVLTVQEMRSNGIKDEQFICYLPVSDITPQRILGMSRRMPWSIAVPADVRLSSSLTRDYLFRPGEPVTASFSPGKTLTSVKRTLEILIQGVETASHASFVIHRKIDVDGQVGEKYTLHLHKGAFKSLPLSIDDASDLEQYV